MSELNEIRRKVRYSLNPNGTMWAKDTDSVGHKMLANMGWKMGSGLGKNEDGVVEPIKVAFKNNNRGVGCNKPLFTEGVKQQNEFDDLLANLASTYGKNKESKFSTSIEDKSKNTSARLHYAKFTRAKDVSRYSQKDLDIVLGVSTSTKDQSPPKESTEDSYLLKTSCVNMKDYFSKKEKDKQLQEPVENNSSIDNNINADVNSNLDEDKAGLGIKIGVYSENAASSTDLNQFEWKMAGKKSKKSKLETISNAVDSNYQAKCQKENEVKQDNSATEETVDPKSLKRKCTDNDKNSEDNELKMSSVKCVSEEAHVTSSTSDLSASKNSNSDSSSCCLLEVLSNVKGYKYY